MNFEEFLNPKGQQTVETVTEDDQEDLAYEPEELDVQKVVVEELAADKVKQDEEIETLKAEVARLSAELEERTKEVSSMNGLLESERKSREEIEGELSKTRKELDSEMERKFDLQERNPNALALLDRDVDLPDYFPGETRDHVLEVVRDARDKAESEGRIRRAQLLEGVLLANEPNGKLARKRTEMEKLFRENGNILSGNVIDELQRRGIPYKKGEEYLLPSEIMLRNY